MGEQTVEVIVNGAPVCLLPAVSAGYAMNVHGEGILTIGLHVAEPLLIEGGEPQPAGRGAVAIGEISPPGDAVGSA